jgi:ArsR family transcriptional regulator, arsenate/arsenite/antimonite-responsive transcriptional repressor
MSIGHNGSQPAIDVVWGTGPALLVALSAASRRPRAELSRALTAALDAVGDTEGEVWLNLLGLPLDAGAPHDVERLVAALGELDPVDVRRHVLGRYAWSWCTLGGVDDIEAAAAGDRAAAERLRSRPRYYGGHAEASLATIIELDGEEVRARLLEAVRAGAETLLPDAAAARLDAAARAAIDRIDGSPPLTAIERLTAGYRYHPEPEAERVVLVPHLEPALPLVLAQHRSARLIAYHAAADRSAEEQLLALGRALADPKRVEILALVGQGVGRASALVAETGLSRSTVHHHLAQLRETGLVALEGNARAYSYVPRREAAADTAALLAGFVQTEKPETTEKEE